MGDTLLALVEESSGSILSVGKAVGAKPAE